MVTFYSTIRGRAVRGIYVTWSRFEPVKDDDRVESILRSTANADNGCDPVA